MEGAKGPPAINGEQAAVQPWWTEREEHNPTFENTAKASIWRQRNNIKKEQLVIRNTESLTDDV